jgi:MoaA/NifB/PqqE/SkfB family radical SAM enzyme
MRSRRVFTNHRCNQNCSFCTFRRTADDPRAIAGAAVRAAIDEAVGPGLGELTLTGGEPTMRRDLVDLVAHARSRGAGTIVLETNATLVDEALARGLAAAGLTVARVHLPLASGALDLVTRDPGGFEAALTGLRALRDAGLALEISATLVRSTAAAVTDLPALLAATLGDRLRRVLAVVPVESPDPSEILTHAEAAAALARLDEACQRHEIRLQLAEGSGPPPCVFPPSGRHRHLYALSPGGTARGFRQLAACEGCVVRDRCPGVAEAYLARHPETEVHALTGDRARRRLTLIGSVEQQIERELVQPSFPAQGLPEALVRVQFHCNQACDFCFVSTHLPSASDAAVRRAIEEAAAAGQRVVLSGGEPTLHPRLPEYVRLASERSAGRWPVEIQTNAVLFEDPARLRPLTEAGLTHAFVSLHGSTAAIGDAVTRAPGTHAKTLLGVDHLVAAGVTVVLNFVICTSNKEDLPAVVDLVARRWPGVALNLSFVAPSTDMVPREAWLIPRYSEALPLVEEALRRAGELGVSIIGFESMCGLPLCLVPSRLAGFLDNQPVPEGADQGEFVRAPPCHSCALASRCWGVRRGYVELHGTGELHAIERVPPGGGLC